MKAIEADQIHASITIWPKLFPTLSQNSETLQRSRSQIAHSMMVGAILILS